MAGNGVICTDCLDEYDRTGVNWQTQQVRTVTITGGDAKCVDHYRKWRDRNIVDGEVDETPALLSTEP